MTEEINMSEFIELMELRKTNDSNIILHMFQNPREYRECVAYYTGLLNDLSILDIMKKYPNRTVYNLTNGLKLILLLNHNIEKLHGYRYKTFRLFGNYEVKNND